MPSLSAMTKEVKKKSESAPLKKPTPRPGLPGIFKSAEKVADSDLDSDTESDSDSDTEPEPSKPAVKPVQVVSGVNGHRKMAPTKPDSDSEDEDESESSEEDSSDSGSSSSNDEESESEEDDIPEKMATKAVSPRKPSNPAPAASIPSQPKVQYIPPSGFEPVVSGRDANIIASQMFNNQNLSGKQVWYITAPASVPISAIKNISLQDVQMGKPSVSLNGQDYGFVQDNLEDKGNPKVMLPDGSSSTYRLADRPIEQTLHLQQIVQLPTIVNGSSSQHTGPQVPSRATVPAKKPIRQQPEGLKMRFLPLGSFSMDTAATSRRVNKDSDVEMSDAPAKFKQPPKFSQVEAESDTTSSDGDSSSGDEELTDGKKSLSQIVVPTNTSTTESSDTSSESEGDESSVDSEDNVLAKSLPSKGLSNSQQSLKRKLSDMNNSNPHSSLSQSPLLNGTQLKKVKLNQTISPVPAPVLFTSSNTDGINRSTMPPPKSTPIPPPKSSRIRSTESPVSRPVRQSPIPIPRSIISRPRLSTESSTASSALNRSESENGQTILPSKSQVSHSSGDTIQAASQSLTEVLQRKAIKRHKRKEKLDKEQAIVENNADDRPKKKLSDAQSTQTLLPSSVIRPSHGQIPGKITPQTPASNHNSKEIQRNGSIAKSKKSRKSKGDISAQGKELSPSVLSSITPVPPPKRVTAISPPKLKASGSV